MSATTVKIEGDLLEDIRRVIDDRQSITAFIRDSIRAEIKRRTFTAAAEQYQQFLAKDAGENAEMDLWLEADLSADVPKKKS